MKNWDPPFICGRCWWLWGEQPGWLQYGYNNLEDRVKSMESEDRLDEKRFFSADFNEVVRLSSRVGVNK